MKSSDNPGTVRLSDDDIERLLTATMDKLAAEKGMHALDLNTDIMQNKTLRNAFARAVADATSATLVDADRRADFDAGWRTAATWAIRDDLLADMKSPAYTKDRDEALAAIAPLSTVAAPAPAAPDATAEGLIAEAYGRFNAYDYEDVVAIVRAVMAKVDLSNAPAAAARGVGYTRRVREMRAHPDHLVLECLALAREINGQDEEVKRLKRAITGDAQPTEALQRLTLIVTDADSPHNAGLLEALEGLRSSLRGVQVLVLDALSASEATVKHHPEAFALHEAALKAVRSLVVPAEYKFVRHPARSLAWAWLDADGDIRELVQLTPDLDPRHDSLRALGWIPRGLTWAEDETPSSHPPDLDTPSAETSQARALQRVRVEAQLLANGRGIGDLLKAVLEYGSFTKQVGEEDAAAAVEGSPGESELEAYKIARHLANPATLAALRAAEASLTEMVRDGRAWDCDKRALSQVRGVLPTHSDPVQVKQGGAL